MSFAIGSGSFDMHGGAVTYSSRSTLENDINKLKQQREEYLRRSDSPVSKAADARVTSLENRIENLQKRLDKLKKQETEQDDGKCETCENRMYQDGSDDPGVSFKSAAKIDPANAESVVRGHEYEHVNRNQAKAAREGKEIVYQSVVIKHGICPECGDSYVAGGETTTVTRTKPEDERFAVGMKDDESGKLLNVHV